MFRALRIFSLLASFCPAILTFSQNTFGNEWFHAQTSQPWVKVLVENDGVYRIYPQDLPQPDNFSHLSQSGLKLFHRGKEIPIYVKSSGNTWSYLEFVGKKNDGGDDQTLFDQAENQANPYKSLFTDQSAYFLSWSETPGKRYLQFFDPIYSGKESEPYVYTEKEVATDFSTYVAGGGGPYSTAFSLNSRYVEGEGYHLGAFSRNNPLEFSVTLPGIIPNDTADFFLDFGTFGASQTRHIIRVEELLPDYTRILDTIWNPQDIYLASFEKKIRVPTDSIHTYRLRAFNEPSDDQSLRWFKIHYPHILDLEGKGRIDISRWAKTTDGFLNLKNFGASNEIHAYYDLEPIMAFGMVSQNTARINLPGTQHKQGIWIAGNEAVLTPEYQDVSFSGLCSNANEADILIITHPSLLSSASAYKAYRELQGYSTFLATTGDIYDEFGYGSKTPQAIKRFCACARKKWSQSPEHVVLWGKAYQQERDHAQDLVPSYGYPASDWLLVMEDQHTIPEMAIGRIPVSTNEEGMNYLSKIQLYEIQAGDQKMKKGVLIGGGITSQEQEQIEDALDRYTDYFIDSESEGPFFHKVDASFSSDSNYHQTISDGVGWIHFMGHPLQNAEDIELFEASAYQNDSHYPFIFAMGDERGEFTAELAFGEKWIIEDGKGAIAYLGASAIGFLSQQEAYGDRVYDNLFFKHNGSIGTILKESIRDIIMDHTLFSYRNQAIQFNLLGDPLLDLHIAADITTSLDETDELLYDVKIYPNPANQQFTIDYQLPPHARELHVRMINMLGIEVSRTTIHSPAGQANINLDTHSKFLMRKGKMRQSGQSYFLDILITDF